MATSQVLTTRLLLSCSRPPDQGSAWTPPSVTSRPRSLMDTGTLNRYTQGRAAQDLRQLVGNQTIDGVTPEQRYESYAGLLGNTGSYGGGLSRSQLFALKRQQDSQQARARQEESTGTIADYLRLNEDVGIDYARAKAAGEIPANTTPEAFALNHYNTYGRAEIAAGTRTPFTLAQTQGSGPKYTSPAIGQFGEGDEESRQSNFTTRGYDTELLARDLGTAGGARIVPVFAEGGPVKKPRGFEDGGPADSMTADELTAQLMAMDTQEAPVPAQEPRPTDQVQTESQAMLDRLLTTATRTPFTPEGERSIFGNAIAGIPNALEGLYDYGKEVVTSPSPSAKFLTDLYGTGKAVKQSAKEDPAGFALDNLPVSQQVRAVNRADEASGLANAARARGDFEEADRLEAAVTVEMISAFPFMKAKAPKVSKKGIITVADDLPAGDVVKTDSRKLLDNLTATTQIETPALDAPAPTGTATVPVPPAEIIPDAKGHALPPILLTAGTGEKAVMPVVQSFTPQNKDVVLGEIDAVVRTNPNALASANNWLTAEAQAFGGDYLPAPPSQAIDYNQTPSALAAKLDKLTPQLKATVDEGFRYVNEIKNLYISKIATPDLTGRMFLWGILSRGAGPAQQEAAFLDLVSKAEPYIAKSVNGEFTDADLVSWKQMVSESLPEGSPAKSVTMNANAAGTLLKALSEKSPSGQSVLKVLHNDLADPRVSGPQFRRKFFELTNKPGIDNKVVSFIGLVSGKDDLLVMDRIQSRHLWDDGRYQGKNIYDGIGSNKGGLSKILGGPRGLMITEMLENGLRDSAKKAYEMIGRPQDGSLGRMHWETWLIEGNQGVSHSTLQSVRSGSPIGFGVTEGKPGTFSSGMTYRQAINGPVVEYPLSDGNVVRMTPERQKEFESFIKKPKNGIVPKGFKVKQAVTWYERPEVNRRKLDDAARQFENANPDGSLRSGDVRPYAGGDTLSERRRKFLRSFRADQGRRAAATGVVQGLDNGRRAQEASGPYQRGTVEGYGGDGLLSFSPDSSALTQYQSAGLNLPVIRQVEAAANAPAYNVEMTNAMKGHRLGAQVEIKSTEDLSGYNLFRTEAGSGFAIKPDGDIVAVFASPNEPKGGSFAMLQAAVQAGGTKLDAFDTYLPEIYEAVGFRPVARLPWNDEFAPPNWDKKAFAKYSQGEPDVVFFVYDPEYFGGAKDVPVVTDYDDAVRLQDEALGAVTAPAKTPAKKGKVTFQAFGGSLGDARQKLGITPEKIEQFKAANKGTKQEPVPEVMAAAKKLKAGEISTQEYNQIVKKFQPIKPLGAVQKRPTYEEIAMALSKNETDSAGIVGVNLDVPDGTMISSRLDIPAYENRDTWVVTLHDGTINNGLAVGYAPTAVLNDVKFTTTKAAAALNMATKDTSKGTIARINGSFENRDPAAVEQLAKDILNGTAPDAGEWTEVGMNPFRHSYFYRKSDGMPVANAEQVIQVGPLVLAKKVKTRPIESPEHLIKTPKGERYFKHGGSVERVYNDNRTYK
jgi:hypothetical protein